MERAIRHCIMYKQESVKNLQGNMLLAVCWNVDFAEVTCQGGHGIVVPNILRLFGLVSQVQKREKSFVQTAKGYQKKLLRMPL